MSDNALLEMPLDPNQEEAGPVCEKCQQPVADEGFTACPHCGWYARAGVFVEIDKQWEAATSGEPMAEPTPSMTEVWLNLLPQWAWVIIGSGVAALAASGVVRFVLQESALRGTWAVAQLLAGIALALACHFVTFVLVSMDDPDMGLGDIIISPAKGWRKLFAQMPKNQWAPSVANASLCASLGAVLIIGAIPYDRIWDWGISAPAKKNLMAAIADAGPGGGGDMSMEEAMDSFAQDAAVRGGGSGGSGMAKPSAPANLERKKTDVLILGYHTDQNGQISELLVASEFNGKLYYGGRVKPSLSLDENLELLERLRAATSPRPLVSAPDGANWVQPRFPCRVSYEKRVESGRLQGLVWEELLGEVKLPW